MKGSAVSFFSDWLRETRCLSRIRSDILPQAGGGVRTLSSWPLSRWGPLYARFPGRLRLQGKASLSRPAGWSSAATFVVPEGAKSQRESPPIACRSMHLSIADRPRYF